MARFALIRNGKVANIVEQSAPPASGQWVDVTGLAVGPGFTYTDGLFSKPVETVSLSVRDFLRRFTIAEREKLEELADTGSAAVKKKLAAFKFYIQTGGNVETADDYIIETVQAMETAGVLAAGRAAEVLS